MSAREILDRAGTDAEWLVKLGSIRIELQTGRRQDRYESKDGRWSLALSPSAEGDGACDAPTSPEPDEAAGASDRDVPDEVAASGDRPRCTPTTTFETFPFPDGLTPDLPAAEYADDPRAVAIAEATQRLVELRDRWLDAPEWVEWVDEPMPGYPKRPVARDETAARELKARTLTNLYNIRRQWLTDAHAALDAAVAAAYGWAAGISEDEALRRLLELNPQAVHLDPQSA